MKRYLKYNFTKKCSKCKKEHISNPVCDKYHQDGNCMENKNGQQKN